MTQRVTESQAATSIFQDIATTGLTDTHCSSTLPYRLAETTTATHAVGSVWLRVTLTTTRS